MLFICIVLCKDSEVVICDFLFVMPKNKFSLRKPFVEEVSGGEFPLTLI
jgi:hypothetical protein